MPKLKKVPLSTAATGTGRWIDQRLGIGRALPSQMNKVFPDHWSFMLGEVTLYCFVVLMVTGVYLTFFFEPSAQEVIYNGSYGPLVGTSMTAAYQSALDISFDVKAGLLSRQLHHWSALIFMAAMVAHVMRVFFTGAYRKPREINWIIGVGLLVLSMFNGLLGYSLLDDLLSGTGVRVSHSLLLSIPFVGPHAAGMLFGGEFGSPDWLPRFYTLHVLLLPAAITGLLGAHLALTWFQKHTQFRGPERTENNVVGTRLFPVYALKALGLLFIVTAVLVIISGIAQINPVWKFGPFHGDQVAASVTSASQPDWYMGWLDGFLRVIPGWETRIEGFYIPNYFWGSLVLPGVTFGAMVAWPFIEARLNKDNKAHNLLDRPRDAPFRTAFGAAVFVFYFVGLLAGSNDILATVFRIELEMTIHILRALLIIGPVVTYLVTKRICEELNGTNAHPAAPGPNHMVIRNASGGYSFGHGDHHDAPEDRKSVPGKDNTDAPAPGDEGINS